MNKSLCILLFLIKILFILSCQQKKEERTQLYENERVIFDSLYNVGIEKIKKEVDSLCATQREDLFQRAVDSIYEIRLEEIENLLQNEQ
jgi:hypothetical protein